MLQKLSILFFLKRTNSLPIIHWSHASISHSRGSKELHRSACFFLSPQKPRTDNRTKQFANNLQMVYNRAVCKPLGRKHFYPKPNLNSNKPQYIAVGSIRVVCKPFADRLQYCTNYRTKLSADS